MTAFGNGPAFENMDSIQRWAFEHLLDDGISVSPRGIATRELLGQSFTLINPRQRVVRSPSRHWSLALAIGEFCWHASASVNVEALAYYASRWREFASGDGTVIGSCYGRRMFEKRPGGGSRWDAMLALLREDPATRRAVIDLAGNDLLDPVALDVSCTSTFQVFVRSGRLHAVVHMRSNDAVWGLPYDIFLFTMLQEMAACSLGLDVGVYIHGAGSLHLYERHIPLARRVLAEGASSQCAMPTMPLSGLDDFLEAERAIRLGRKPPSLAPYWADLAEVLVAFHLTRSRSYSGIAASE